ncbi:MAG: SDR family NAD(P)-dependent oxidoreductase [Pseudomonadota bacterium]
MKVLITGASHGLGRALTEKLLAEGHDVFAVDRDTDALDALAVKSRGACKPILADMALGQSVERLMREIAGHTFDLVILNAGISATGKFEEIPAAAYQRLIAVNLTAPITIASRLIGENMLVAKSKLVFISSLSHAVGYPGASVYAATKDALAVYARSIRKPLAKKRVGVLTVFPGPIRTQHAERHAPAGAKASKRMSPDILARHILKATRTRKKELYPGTQAAFTKLLAGIAPNFMTKMMRRVIFEKLDDNVY